MLFRVSRCLRINGRNAWGFSLYPIRIKDNPNLVHDLHWTTARSYCFQ